MARFILTAILAICCTGLAHGAEEVMLDNLQTIYTETPVQSYYAYPDDPNFIPETEFMDRADSLDYDQAILDAQAAEYYMHPGVSFASRPMVICRDFGCTRLNDKITRTFLFNSLANMFMMNSHSRDIYARRTRSRAIACSPGYPSPFAAASPTPW